MKNSSVKKSKTAPGSLKGYDSVLSGLVDLLESARRTSSRTVNAIMTATYWEIGRRIVEFEQGGEKRAEYGDVLLKRLAIDLTAKFGRGFGVDNLQRMRAFYIGWPANTIYATLSRKYDQIQQTRSAESIKPQIVLPPSPQFITIKEQKDPDVFSMRSGKSATLSRKSKISQTASAKLSLSQVAVCFPLPWSHYVRLLSVKKPEARSFYETEALRCGWSVRQLDRQISTLFYERTLLSKNKAMMLKKGAVPKPGDLVIPDEEIKDPYILEFLNLKDEYSENDLEEALIQQLEKFLLELGGDFAFIGRQRRLRIGDDWYRVDLLFFHRRLQCLVVIDLKVGKFTHADAGQMHLYLNYAREHWTNEGENPPVGLILCAEKNAAVAHYALEGLPNKVMAAEYKMKLPDEKMLAAELRRSRKLLESRFLVSAKKESRE
jgi:predicted nuclease of restriction endonuclease-like (RecB) superfamily